MCSREILADQIAPVFRIKPRRDAGRTNQIAEQHGDMPTLANGFRNWRFGWLRSRWSRGFSGWGVNRTGSQSGNRIQQLHTVPNRGDAKLLQGLVRQARKNRLVYVILAERRLVLAEAKAPQPDHDVHDGAHNREWRTSSAGEARVSRADWIMGVSEVHKDRCGNIANGRVYRRL
jgi:hypothetical protein